MTTNDPLNRPKKDLVRELKELGVSMGDYIKALKAKWGSDWESHFPKNDQVHLDSVETRRGRNR